MMKGGPRSPLLSNIYLADLEYVGYEFHRYRGLIRMSVQEA